MSQELLQISQKTKCIETIVLIGVAVTIVVMEKETFFSLGYFPSKRKGAKHLTTVSI
jgi:hypothetical protein